MPNLKREVNQLAFSPEFLKNRMAFIAGPRQIGKTTSVKNFLKTQKQEHLYYNWDSSITKKRFATNPLFFVEDLPSEISRPFVAIDEIHKYPKWKNILKGYYDEWGQKIQFIVTGSARLDHFRKSGDSLLGRYFLFHLLPLGPYEVLNSNSLTTHSMWLPGQELKIIPQAPSGFYEATQNLYNLTGYPEPFLANSQDFCNRWRNQHVSLILQEDLRDLTKIVHLKKIETLLYLLPERVSSPMSLNALARPLEAAFGSVRLWLEALKLVYLIFSIPPWTSNLSRSILKEEKYYFWDWGMIETPGARFENFIAAQLTRVVSYWNELGKGPFKLYYLRTKDGREVDFAIADRHKVRLLVEAKVNDDSLSTNLGYFQEKLGAEYAVQVIQKKGHCVQKGKNIYIMGVDRFLALLP